MTFTFFYFLVPFAAFMSLHSEEDQPNRMKRKKSQMSPFHFSAVSLLKGMLYVVLF